MTENGGAVVVTVDPFRCVGSGQCATTAPRDLALGADGRARALHPASESSPELTEAAEMCPVEAIRVLLAATGEVIAPTG